MYIRTKDGVYKVSHYNDWATHKRKGATLIDGDKLSYIKNEDIINQSENLEELCDEVVFYAKGFIKPQVYDKLQKKEIAVMKQMVNSTIEDVKLYYAIWTSKGLIYVAKMDSEGELVLI